jgi:DNA-binding CsgD family transcriptional regulator
VTTSDPNHVAGGNDRLLETLQRLLGIQAPELSPALDQASSLVAEALGADKVDVFLHDADSDSLVAMGTSDTPMGHAQHQAGLNRQPIANNGPAVQAFQTGTPYLHGRIDHDPDQPRGMIHRLGIRSEMDVPLDVAGQRRGIVQADSQQVDFFTERDLHFLTAVSGWIGMVTQRSELFEQVAREAERRGERRTAEEIGRITRREREIAALIAEGLTNAELGDRLTLTEGTIGNHVAHILRKLGLKSRTQIAVWAVERGLYRSGDEAEER